MSDVTVSPMHDARDEEDGRLLEAGEHRSLPESYFETIIQRCRVRCRSEDDALRVALTVIVGAIILIAIGKEIGGLIALLTTLVGVVGLFVYTRREERAEVRENLRHVDDMSPPEE